MGKGVWSFLSLASLVGPANKLNDSTRRIPAQERNCAHQIAPRWCCSDVDGMGISSSSLTHILNQKGAPLVRLFSYTPTTSSGPS
ncbi:MAG: hypothetical protein RI911_13 [Candidatus Parcubacteria bacterium]|jgi:hypothetical protein